MDYWGMKMKNRGNKAKLLKTKWATDKEDMRIRYERELNVYWAERSSVIK